MSNTDLGEPSLTKEKKPENNRLHLENKSRTPQFSSGGESLGIRNSSENRGQEENRHKDLKGKEPNQEQKDKIGFV